MLPDNMEARFRGSHASLVMYKLDHRITWIGHASAQQKKVQAPKSTFTSDMNLFDQNPQSILHMKPFLLI